MPLPLAVTAPSTGCLLCRAPLVYAPSAEPVRCAVCGGAFESLARCAGGHYVCDACHAAPAREVVERFCAATDLRDPVEIALQLMRHPSVKMHGPEHHFLVPASLIAAWANASGATPERRAGLVAEARKRSEPILGGFCGVQGACGAGVGTGTFVALATGATPLKGRERTLSNRMTARALDAISRTGAARCCKRDSLLSILAAARFSREELGVALPARGRPCEFSASNAECSARDCPFFPRPR
jgi:LSD1 subclass zinc finger protein